MYGMILHETGAPLVFEELPDPTRTRRDADPGGSLRRLPDRSPCCRWRAAGPEAPGHSGTRNCRADRCARTSRGGHRARGEGCIPWLGSTCGVCAYCVSGRENLCDRPVFTGYTRNGGYATHAIAAARYAFPLREEGDAAALAPLLCAGLIGWRSLCFAGSAKTLGL
jgi:alcohol dehydrogenase, propanol-preferring